MKRSKNILRHYHLCTLHKFVGEINSRLRFVATNYNNNNVDDNGNKKFVTPILQIFTFEFCRRLLLLLLLLERERISTPSVNFINILRKHFARIFWCQKIQSWNVIREICAKHFHTKNACVKCWWKRPQVRWMQHNTIEKKGWNNKQRYPLRSTGGLRHPR